MSASVLRGREAGESGVIGMGRGSIKGTADMIIRAGRMAASWNTDPIPA
jgi:hypothetical protein